MMPWVGRFRILLLSGIWAALALGPVEESAGYVMPPEQILEYMAKHVLGFETLGMVWDRHRGQDEHGGDGQVPKKVWFQPPDTIRVEQGEKGHEGGGPPWLESGYLALFSGEVQEAERLLARLGVGLHHSAYDRVEGTVAYRIGAPPGEGPALLLEKQRFLPLLLVFEPPGARVGERSRVRFKDYRKIGDGWFPQEIVCRAASGVTRAYTVRNVSVNTPVPAWDRASPAGEAPEGDRDGKASKRLERVLRTFEEQYGSDGGGP